MKQPGSIKSQSLEKEVFVYRQAFGTIFYADGTYYTVQIPEVGKLTYLFQNGTVRNDMISRPEFCREGDTRHDFESLNKKSRKLVELPSSLVEKTLAEYQSNVEIVEDLKRRKISEILPSLKEQTKLKTISRDASLDEQLNFVVYEELRLNKGVELLGAVIKATVEYIKNTRDFYNLVCEMHAHISQEAPPFGEKYGTSIIGFTPTLSC